MESTQYEALLWKPLQHGKVQRLLARQAGGGDGEPEQPVGGRGTARDGAGSGR